MDAQVHEELNMATKKKYKQMRHSPNRPDDVLAAEALANYARCNNSFVVDIFQVWRSPTTRAATTASSLMSSR